MDDEDLKKEIESPLTGDDNPPFSPPEDVLNDDRRDPFDRELDHDLDNTHPVTDTNIQPEEVYDEGLGGAAEASEPNQQDAVVDYDPEDDESDQS